jgi:REP element-mobilizing transposase RayT
VRKDREKSDTGTYHIMIRGIDRQLILEDEEDNQKLKEVLYRCKEICGYKIYGYIRFK